VTKKGRRETIELWKVTDRTDAMAVPRKQLWKRVFKQMAVVALLWGLILLLFWGLAAWSVETQKYSTSSQSCEISGVCD
jgi:hypothetical protein